MSYAGLGRWECADSKRAGSPCGNAGPVAALKLRSEHEFRADLNLPRGAVGADLAEQPAGDVSAAEPVRVGMIGKVEKLAAQLQPDALGEDEALHQGPVQVSVTRPAHGAATGIARSDGALRRRLEAGGVEPGGLPRSRDAGGQMRRIGVGIAHHVGSRA